VDQWATPRREPAQTFTPPPETASTTSSDDPWAAPPSVRSPRGTTSEEKVREITLENDPWATIPAPRIRSWTADHQMADDDTEETAEPVEPEVAETVEAETAAPEVIAPEPVRDTWIGAPENGEPRADVDPVAVEAAAAA